MKQSDYKIAIIGLGYVGLPLAIEFGKKRKVTGFDLDNKRINELKSGYDKTLEVSKSNLKKARYLDFTNNVLDLKKSNCFIVSVPTPVNSKKNPDFSYLVNACKIIGNCMTKQCVIIFESTVYPGATEEICVPVLEKTSGLKYNKSFFCGYSPERINPGDKKHKITNIKKITSGSNKRTALLVDKLYGEIIVAGTYLTESIKIAEAAKVIENTQRDINIALINELSIIFDKLDIDTNSVLKAAATKWNFLPFQPGLVGGHCIGVDPYYLTHKAKSVGYKTKIILAGRKLNDSMGKYIVNKLIQSMKKKKIKTKYSRFLIMGLTFKENCKDTRNTKVLDIYKNLKKYSENIDLYEPIASSSEIYKIFKKEPIINMKKNKYDAIILAVPHFEIKKLGLKFIYKLSKSKNIFFDVKSIFDKKESDLRL